MKTLLDVNELLRTKFVNKEDFSNIDEKNINYYIGWYEGLSFIKNTIQYDEHSSYKYISSMLACIEKKIIILSKTKDDDFSFGWLKGYFDSLRWYLD